LPDLTQAARRDHLVSASGSRLQAHRDLRLDYWITTSITAWRDAVSPINALLLGSAISALAALPAAAWEFSPRAARLRGRPLTCRRCCQL
jgi:hypothetical protein